MPSTHVCDPLEALNDALCHEEEGRAFYHKAAAWTKNPDGAAMFHTLAEGAGVRIEMLEAQIEALTEDNTWMLPACVLNCEYDLEAAPLPLDQAAFEREIRPDASEQDAILYALKAESAAYGNYVQQARNAVNDDARRFYTYLAEQANTRLSLLMLGYEATTGALSLAN